MFKKILTFLFLLFFLTPIVCAQEPLQEETLEGIVTEVFEEKLPYQKLEVLITKGSLKDKKITVEVGKVPIANQPKYEERNEVILSYGQNQKGEDIFYITDFIRRRALFWLFLIFVILGIFVAKLRGLTSLLAMAISFLIIFKLVLPPILKGADPVLVTILASLLIVPLTFYLSHGFNKKTTLAIIATFAALIITGLLAQVFVNAARLTGFASGEAAFLQIGKKEVNIRGLILAGIIIGALGILDDITIAQAGIVQQLKEAGGKSTFKELYEKAMKVGQDHIASMINTLVLVYTGASLPLLLLFINNPHPFLEIINYEIIAEEIIRTLVASIGLISAVPITTLLAVSFFNQK